MFKRIGFRWMDKYIVNLGMFPGGIEKIRQMDAREVFRAIAIDIAYNDSMESV